jgi:aromatic ring-cleaving dioxygenase
MSNNWINVRLFYWHLQVGPDYRLCFRLSFNKYHVGRGSPWFEIYD